MDPEVFCARSRVPLANRQTAAVKMQTQNLVIFPLANIILTFPPFSLNRLLRTSVTELCFGNSAASIAEVVLVFKNCAMPHPARCSSPRGIQVRCLRAVLLL